MTTLQDVAETDPCPCGSGGTFAACCLPKLEAAEKTEMDAREAAGPAMEAVGDETEWHFDLGAVRLPFDAKCVNPKCGRPISAGEIAFADRLTRQVWCHNCGKCERYARKKFDERRLAGLPADAETV